MVSLYDSGIYLVNGTEIVPESESGKVKKLTGRMLTRHPPGKGPLPTPFWRPTTHPATWNI